MVQKWPFIRHLFAFLASFLRKSTTKNPTFPAFFPHFWHCFPTNYSVNMTPCRRRPPEHKPQANPSTPAAVNPFPRPQCTSCDCPARQVRIDPAGFWQRYTMSWQNRLARTPNRASCPLYPGPFPRMQCAISGKEHHGKFAPVRPIAR